MIILLNGPLGIGKSTLAEALMESLDGSVMLDGDHVVALNPAPRDDVGYLHSTLSLLIQHHRLNGYRHFIVNHLWTRPEHIADLRHRLAEAAPGCDCRCFLLELPLKENLRRIRVRQAARALEETEFELRTVMEERSILAEHGADGSLGERFDVSGHPEKLVAAILERLGLQ